MNWGIYLHYYCTNGRCAKSRSNYIFKERDYQRNPNCSGCGHPLRSDSPKNYRAVLIAIPGLMMIVSLALINHAMNAPLSGIHFPSKGATLTQARDKVTIQVFRSAAGSRNKAVVRYQTKDESAKASIDYVAQSGMIEFLPGETQKTIDVTLLKSVRMERKSFDIVMANVEGQPNHTIILEPPALDPNVLSKADAYVRNISVLAMDIAENYVRVSVYSDPKAIPKDADLIRQFQINLISFQNRLDDAQKRYFDLMQDLVQLDPTGVEQTFHNWDSRLQQEKADQQRKATKIALKHYRAFLKNRTRSSDWAKDLSRAIPEPSQMPPGPTQAALPRQNAPAVKVARALQARRT